MTRTIWRSGSLLLVLLTLTVLPAVHAAAGPATITYRRVFKGSSPELIEIKITEPGKSTFEIRQLDEDADAETFEVGPAVRQKIFELAADLKNFAIADLDVQKRLANLGQKTFRYERDSEVHETTFNYTLNASANQLMQIFEGLARQQGDLVLLERNVNTIDWASTMPCASSKRTWITGYFPNPSDYCPSWTKSPGIRTSWKLRERVPGHWRSGFETPAHIDLSSTLHRKPPPLKRRPTATRQYAHCCSPGLQTRGFLLVLEKLEKLSPKRDGTFLQ